MTFDVHPDDLLGAYVVEGCASADEVTAVARHAGGCPPCADEIDLLSGATRWLSVSTLRRPAPALRERVLSTALAARPARELQVGRSLDPYLAEVAKFGQLLARLSEPQWRLPSGPYASVREMVDHLAANDRMVAGDLGIAAVPAADVPAADVPAAADAPAGVDVRRRWREQADVLVRDVSRAGPALLERSVRLAGKKPARGPLRDALTQRAFETWIHADDVRAAIDLPAVPPPPEHVARIVEFALRLLPGAMDAAGAGHPRRALRLLLTGPGGSERQVPLSAASPVAPAGEVVAEVTMPAVRFCRLLAGRISVAQAGAQASGDPVAVADFLSVAVTMGCD